MLGPQMRAGSRADRARCRQSGVDTTSRNATQAVRSAHKRSCVCQTCGSFQRVLLQSGGVQLGCGCAHVCQTVGSEWRTAAGRDRDDQYTMELVKPLGPRKADPAVSRAKNICLKKKRAFITSPTARGTGASTICSRMRSEATSSPGCRRS